MTIILVALLARTRTVVARLSAMVVLLSIAIPAPASAASDGHLGHDGVQVAAPCDESTPLSASTPTTTAATVAHGYDRTRGAHIHGANVVPLAQRRDHPMRSNPGTALVAPGCALVLPHFATNSAAVGDDLLKPGPWADGSVLSSAPGKITAAERRGLNTLGEESGCHSCGATTPGTKTGNWVGDHQPVSSGVPAGTPQSLYPQCLSCSNDQGLWIINLIKQGKWPPP